MTSDFALVSGAMGVGHLCPPYLGTRTRHVRGVGVLGCTADVTCDICKGWSVAQWEAFLKKRPFSSRHKHCPSGSSLSPAPQTNPHCASSSSEAVPPLLRGLTAWGEGAPREASPPLFPLGGWGGGERLECSGFWGRAGFGCLFPHGGGG